MFGEIVAYKISLGGNAGETGADDDDSDELVARQVDALGKHAAEHAKADHDPACIFGKGLYVFLSFCLVHALALHENEIIKVPCKVIDALHVCVGGKVDHVVAGLCIYGLFDVFKNAEILVAPAGCVSAGDVCCNGKKTFVFIKGTSCIDGVFAHFAC